MHFITHCAVTKKYFLKYLQMVMPDHCRLMKGSSKQDHDVALEY